jgi:esterase/lipase superfamily enzyme
MLCHSLGNFVFFNALDSISKPIFDQLILSAPDIPRPNDQNLHQYKIMSEIADSITILVNRKDRALLFSGFSNREKRLGRVGVEMVPFDNFQQIETTHHRGTTGGYARISRHTHYRSNRETIQLLVQLLNSSP